MPQQLSFHVTFTCPFPVATTGVGTALTVGRFRREACLIFLAQTGHADEVVYLRTCDGTEVYRHSSPPTRNTIVSMHSDPTSDEVWCANATNHFHEVFAFQIQSGRESRGFNVGGVSDLSVGHSRGPGIATDGVNLYRCGQGTGLSGLVEGFHKDGTLFTSFVLHNAAANDICAAPHGLAYYFRESQQVRIWDKFGQELAFAELPGMPQTSSGHPTNGAIAFDLISHMRDEPQEWAGCVPGPVGTANHPGTSWNPAPFTHRHKLYFANERERIIYGGYLY